MKNVKAYNSTIAIITSASENTDYPFDTGLTDSRLSRTGRTTAITSQWVKFAFAQARPVQICAVLGSNLTDGAVLYLQGNDTDVWTSPSQSVALKFYLDQRASAEEGRSVGTFAYIFDDDDVFFNIITDDGSKLVTHNSEVLTGLENGYKYWRVSIEDSLNPDGYIDIGQIIFDIGVDFPGMEVNQTFAITSESERSFSSSRQLYGETRPIYYGASFSFSSITDTQKKAIEKFFYSTDIIRPFLMIVWENYLDVQPPLYVANSTTPEFKRFEGSSGVLWSVNLTVEEVR